MTASRKTLLYIASEDRAFVSHRLPMARAARDAGFDVHVATHIGADGHRIRDEGLTLHAIPFQRGRLSVTATMAAIRGIRNVEKNITPVLIHHSGLQCCILGTIAAGRLHTPQINALTGLGYAFTSSTAKARILKFAFTALLRWLFNRPQSTTLVQNPDDLLALEAIGVAGKKIVLIPGSGVDTDALTPMPEPSGPITVGFAGRLLADKGIRELVAAHGMLRERGFDVRLLIAGEPDPANPASISQSETEGWTKIPGITLLGQIPDIQELWARSHIAALPSYREGLPKSLLEAAAFGRPLVATDVPGCREIALNEQTGLLVPVGQSQPLADAIARLAQSKTLRDEYGMAARQLVVEKMSSARIGHAIVELYKTR